MTPALVGYLFLSLDLHIFYVIWILLFLLVVVADRDALNLRVIIVLTLIVGGIWLTEELLRPSDGLWRALVKYLMMTALTAFILFLFLQRDSPKPPRSQESDRYG